MSTTFLRLEANDLELAEYLAPFDLLERLELPHYYGIIAVDDQLGAPVGLVIYSYARANRLDIEWLYVYEPSRGKGVGSDLLETVFNIAAKAGIPNVGIRLEGDYISDEFKDAMHDFAIGWGFSYWLGTGGDWRITKKDYDKAMKGRKAIDSVSVVSCAKVDEKLIKAYLQQNYNSLSHAPLYDYKKVIANYDRRMSVVEIKKGEIQGIFLVQKPMQDLYLLAFDAKDARASILLIEGMRKNINAYNVNTSVFVLNSPRSAKLLPDLLPNYGAEPAYVWIADSEEEEETIGEEAFTDNDYFAKNVPNNFRWLKTETYGDIEY